MNETPVTAVDDIISAVGDWRGELLSHVRKMIHEAVPAIVEETKWKKPSNPLGVAAWSSNGLICTGEIYQDKIKLTFAKGASLEDPKGLFNASLTAGTRRAIDLHQSDELDPAAFQLLMQDAAALNSK